MTTRMAESSIFERDWSISRSRLACNMNAAIRDCHFYNYIRFCNSRNKISELI